MKRGLLLTVLLLAACAGNPVDVHFWPPDSPVLPLLTKPEVAEVATGTAEDGPKLNQYVVLLPDENGDVGILQVTDGTTAAVLDEAYEAVRFDKLGETYFAERPQEATPEFTPAIVHEPPPPTSHTLFFELGSAILTANSRQTMEAVVADIGERAAPQVWIDGHADTIGSAAANAALSRQRAETVSRLLLQAGVPAKALAMRWHGEKQPAIPTPDGAREQRNRRVVVKVR